MTSKNEKSNINPFEEVQNNYSIVEVAERLDLNVKRVGSSYRACSLSGGGKNALALNEDTNTWFDFKLNEGGDITDLVARKMFNGDKKQALEYLLPDWKKKSESYSPYFHQKAEFAQRYSQGVENFKNEKFYWHEYLRWRGLTDEYIKKMGFALSWRFCGGCGERLMIPYWSSPSMNEVIYFITRRITEPVKDENGKIISFQDKECYAYSGAKKPEHGHDITDIDFSNQTQERAKYMKPHGEIYPYLKNCPWGLHTMYRNQDILFIAEGMFDAMLLDQDGASVLSPASGTFGKNWDSVLHYAKGFKYVILAFDNDDAGKNFTFEAAKQMLNAHIPFKCANFYGKDIAEFYQVAGGNLNKLVKSAVNGIDWIANRITENKSLDSMTSEERDRKMDEFKEMLIELGIFCDASDIMKIVEKVKYYFPKEWLRAIKKEALSGGSEQYWANKLIEKYNIAYDDRMGIYSYNTTKFYWQKITETTLAQYAMQLIGEKCTVTKMKKVAQAVKVLTNNEQLPRKMDKLQRFVFRNNTIKADFEQSNFAVCEHDMSDYNTVVFNYDYAPAAKCVKFLKALDDIFNGNQNSINTLQEWFGYTLLNDCRYHKALMAVGTGSNGKSFVTEILREMLGGDNEDGRSLVSNVITSRLNKDFRSMVLRGSWLNISSESDVNFDGSSQLKTIIAGEIIEDSYKGKDPISFRPRAKLWTNCNEFPIINDKSYGMIRRLLFLEFPVQFVDNPREQFSEKKSIPDLAKKIINDPEEMSGIFNWALEGLKRLLKNNGFTRTPEMERIEKNFMRYNNEFIDFIEENQAFFKDKETGKGIVVDRREVYTLYKAYAIENNEEVISARRFYHLFENTSKILSFRFIARQRSYITEWDFSEAAS